jgi:hypothetical protein
MPQIYIFDDNPVSVEIGKLKKFITRPWTLQPINYKNPGGDHYTDPGPVVAQCRNGLVAGSVLILDAASPRNRKTFWADVVLCLAKEFNDAAVRGSHVIVHSAYGLDEIERPLSDYPQAKALKHLFGKIEIEHVGAKTATNMMYQAGQYEEQRSNTIIPYVPKMGDGRGLEDLVSALIIRDKGASE